MNCEYKTTDEFMNAYTNGTLNEFNEKLYGDYIDFNFESDDLFDYYNVDLQYKNGCDCLKIITHQNQHIFQNIWKN